MRYRDDLPFQTLGRVDGEYLNPPGRHGDLGRGQPVLHRRGGVGNKASGPVTSAPGAPQPTTTSVSRSGVRRRSPRRLYLGVDPEDPADLGDQVDQRVRQEAAQPGQFGTQGGDAPMPSAE